MDQRAPSPGGMEFPGEPADAGRSQPPRTLSRPMQEARSAIEDLGPRAAIAKIEELLSRCPDDPDLQPILALAELGCGELDRARHRIRDLLAAGPTVGAYAVASDLAVFENEPERSDEMLRKAQAMDPDHCLALRATATRALMDNDTETARRAMTRSLELYPRDREALRLLVMVYRLANDEASESAVLDTPPDWYAGTTQYYRGRFHRAYSRRDIKGAEAEARNAVAACSGRDAQAWADLAVALLHLNRHEESAECARHALDINPRQANALNTLASLALARGDRRAAARLRRQAAEAIPAMRGQQQLYAANEALRRGDLRRAEAAFREAERTGPSVAARSARLGLVQALVAFGRWDRARAELDRALAEDELSDPLRTARMQILEHEGKAAEAERDMAALTEGPSPYAGAVAVGIIMWHRRGRDDRVAQLASYARRRLPGAASDLAEMVVALDSVGRHEDARKLFEAAERLHPSDEGLRLMAVGLAASDGREGHFRYEVRRLPPEVRRRLFGPGVLLRPWFWRALFVGLLRRRRE